MNIPPDLNDPNASHDPNLAPPALDPGEFALKKKGSKTPLFVIIGVVVAAIGFFAYRSVKTRDERKAHAAFMESFADIERAEAGKFWQCILGPNVDPGAFPDNLALAAKITSNFGTDAKNYPNKVREECTPKAVDAKHKVENLQALPEYGDALKKYGASLQTLATAFDDWSKIAPAQVQQMEVGKKVGTFGAAWHAFPGGKPGNDVIAYDRFIHCAVPTLDAMNDGQAVVQYLFDECKKPTYPQRVEDECGKELLADPPGAATKGMMAAIKKFQADDRELEAFDDCLRKGRKGKRRDDLAEVGKAWMSYLEAGREIKKIGKEALKDN
jgi:hypothetical protein